MGEIVLSDLKVKVMVRNILAFFFWICFSYYGIKASPVDSAIVKNLNRHITYLASDKLEGRNTGSKGEQLAYKYIIQQYKEIGISAKGTGNSYIQSFTFTHGREVTGKNELEINGTKLLLNEDYYPINISANGKAKGKITDVGFGIVAPEIQYNSYSGLSNLKETIYIIECSTPEGDNPHSKYAAHSEIRSKIEEAIKKGAVAILFTNTLSNADDLKPNFDINSSSVNIPVVFVKSASLKKILKNEFNVASITVNLKKIELTGHNVAGFLDNGAAATVVIGAHYDHLGYGEYENSLYRGEKAIHNGADDNASGTAAVIELARYLKNNRITEKNNFLFLNFSGEELGLIGSKYWVEHATYDTSSINYMINMDMVGRYDPAKGMEISGLGTSPEAFNFISTASYNDLKFKLGEKGTGPTDHTSFYYANIPVLNFFTGTHEDYHKPTDDADKINYGGEAEIVLFIGSVIMNLDDDGILPFTKTQETDSSAVPEFKVRLGIIPDYLFEGPGLRVDGVDEGKPAAKAGIIKGDIILSIGDHNVGDIMDYMKALGSFNKGDTTTLIVKRGDSSAELKVTF
jgi:hypothetical protein